MSLLYHEVKDVNIDLNLPHCWYRWGDEVVRYLMPYPVNWNHEEAPYTKVYWSGKEPEGIGYDTLPKQIGEHVENLIEKYPIDDIEKLVDAVYDLAPFEFQRKYRKCRLELEALSRRNVDIKDYGKEHLLPIIEVACDSFPHDQFDVVSDKIPELKELINLLLSKSEPNFTLINEISEEFWFLFCYYLRLHPDAHENVTRETLDIWDEKLEWETEMYNRMFGDHLITLESSFPDLKNNPILGNLIEQRKINSQKEMDTLSSFDQDFSDLEDFLTIRTNKNIAK